MTVRKLESVHRLRYFRFCNVLHIWTIRAIPTYRVYRLYDKFDPYIIKYDTGYINIIVPYLYIRKRDINMTIDVIF